MPNHREKDWLLGRTYATSFRVLSIDDDREQTATLAMHGERYRISLAELMVLIERGFVLETDKEEDR